MENCYKFRPPEVQYKLTVERLREEQQTYKNLLTVHSFKNKRFSVHMETPIFFYPLFGLSKHDSINSTYK